MEEAVGISAFLTKTQGIGGRLRMEPEDFVVNELSADIQPSDGGRYTVARIRSRNWETNRLVRVIARELRISRKKIRFGGTKDKRAVTTQLFQFEHPAEGVRKLDMRDVDVLEVFRTAKRMGMGDLYGNRFDVLVKDIEMSLDDAYALAFETASDVLETGGFPNFFGVQRFGAIRPITHLVGKHIVRGDLEQAVMTYVANPIEGEPEESFEARKALEESGDFSEALKNYPDKLSFEKAVLNRLVRDEEDYVGALNQLPDNLLLMFIHAYQSYLFNNILSERMRRGHPLNEPLIGDLILPLDRFDLPDHKNRILVKERNLEKVAKHIQNGKAFVSAVLFGTESEFAEGEMGDIEKKIIDDEGLERGDFHIQQIRRLSSKGTRREILAILNELELGRGGDNLAFRFKLNKGCYATSLLREFMKTDARNY